MRTLIKIRELTRVFSVDSADLHAHIARLSVLYEDLRIETSAIKQDSIPSLDVTDEVYRRHYFFRRSIATLLEFAESVRLLDVCHDFQGHKAHFPAEVFRKWNRAVRYLRKYEPLLQKVRNDTGGHFGHAAAKYAVMNLNPSAVGKIEAKELTGGISVHLQFAGEVAAVAITRHIEDFVGDRKFGRLIKIVRVGFRHATLAVDCLVFTYLWDRFS